MARPSKRRLEDFDPNASDPDDSDFDERATRPQRRSRKGSSGPKRKPQKRSRRNYDSDIVDDEDDLEMDDSFGSHDESDEEVERNERGRAVRKATKKEIKYEEESEDEIEGSESDDEDELVKPSRRGNPKKQTLVIKLKACLPSQDASSRRTRGGKAPGNNRSSAAPEMVRTRRSSRLSHDEEAPLHSLTNSGRHVNVQRSNTRSPETMDIPRRASRATKGLKKPPSAIMEASQEDSQRQTQQGDEDAVEDAEEGEDAGPEAQMEENAESEPPAGDVAILTSDVRMGEVEESEAGDAPVKPTTETDDEDEGPITRGGRQLRSRKSEAAKSTDKKGKRAVEESSDFEPAGDEEKEDEDVSDSEASKGKSRRKNSSDSSATKARRYPARNLRSRPNSNSGSELDQDELLEEAEELAMDKARTRRGGRSRHTIGGITYEAPPALRSRGNKVDYRIFRPELAAELEEEDNAPTATPSRRRGGGGGGAAWKSLFSTQGPFGGHEGPKPLFGGPDGVGAVGGIDSDSSDDEQQAARPSVGGAVGMTPTSAFRPNFLNNDPAQAKSGGPANLGKVPDRKALADSDPLGVDQTVTFDGVGGLDDHINQLKEMVMLPLLYPELFKNFNVTPPRGVLFHGPPGTGKTLLARALASSVSSGGQKVTFYMRKGADALSKWVGEAERQLRMLFEEARKNQPSIIFFDEIDGLAPVRSSKQEQIHASIVATLLALMDGMDGRGQVIVIGATNRPDSVDPALRRPGRFDREFYFPLPSVAGRRAIIDIHTKGWEPPLKEPFKDQLSELTKGYGGADLRALCTEAALNAIQGTYPQIYKSNKKYIVDPNAIKVLAKDFMISVNKMIPSSERSAHSAAAPLPKKVEPLLREPFKDLTKIIDEIIPRKRKLTALEEAEYDDRDDATGFEREMMETEFQRARIFRPRLLVRGLGGMGQQYISSALLNKFEGLFVQSFDLATLLEDSSRSPEAAVVQLFKEVRRHKPSVIYIPNVDVWYQTVPHQAIKMFKSLLTSLRPDESVLLLGMIEDEEEVDMDVNRRKETNPRSVRQPNAHSQVVRDLFGFSLKNQYHLKRPSKAARKEYFSDVVRFASLPPSHFVDPDNRKKRKLAHLELAPEKAPIPPSKEELRAQKKADRLTLNRLKTFIQPVMDQIKQKYRMFRFPCVDEKEIGYLFEEQDSLHVSSDLRGEQQVQHGQVRPYEISTDKHGVPGLLNSFTKKFFYNVDITMIEKRLSNGYYKRPKDYYDDIKRLVKDWSTFGNHEKMIKANELLTNVEVDMASIEQQQPALVAECDAVYAREKARADQNAKTKPGVPLFESTFNVPPDVSHGTTDATNGTAPITLGMPIPGRHGLGPATPIRGPHASGTTQSNGVVNSQHLSNVPAGPEALTKPVEDTTMIDSQDVTGDTENKTQPYGTPTAGPSQHTQKSQWSAHTHLDQAVDPRDLQNSASTTTSGQKTDQSNRYSTSNNTQSTNGYPSVHHPDFSAMAPPSAASQIPDTQGTYSSVSGSNPSTNSSPVFPSHSSQQSNSQPSQSSQAAVFPVPPLPRQQAGTSIDSLLNAEVSPKFILDSNHLGNFHDNLTEKSSGLSVEQLEQVNANLMDTVWRHRHEWNRSRIVDRLTESFEEIMTDIEQMQSLLPPSQEQEQEQMQY